MIAVAEPVANGHTVPIHQKSVDASGVEIMTVACQDSVLLQVYVIEVGNNISQEHGLREEGSVMSPCIETTEGCYYCADVESKCDCLPALPCCAQKHRRHVSSQSGAQFQSLQKSGRKRRNRCASDAATSCSASTDTMTVH